ncbi:MAG: molecular chaperone TorD family protein [Planctomycetales bacterium]|nr:molecular chaperone TorD family protein [Planctomycetales bacterium]
MCAPRSTRTPSDRAEEYGRLSRAVLAATAADPTLTPDCPPYETQYGSAHIFMQTTDLADIAGFYRACGLGAPEKERVDHLAVELEFLGFLARKEEHARATGRCHRAEECRAMQTAFFRDHLGRWAPAFARRFASRDPALARSLEGWLAREREDLGLAAEAARLVDLVPAADPAAEDLSCGGGSSCETPSSSL